MILSEEHLLVCCISILTFRELDEFHEQLVDSEGKVEAVRKVGGFKWNMSTNLYEESL